MESSSPKILEELKKHHVADSEQKTRIKFSQIVEDTDFSNRKTKIICTVGPACGTVDKLVEMLDAGMNVARLNFSHGDHKSHGEMVAKIREALKQRPNVACALMLDTKGPEIRTGVLKDGKPIDLISGQELELVSDYTYLGDTKAIACSYEKLTTTVKPGNKILIADGTIVCTVLECRPKSVLVRILNNAKLGEKKNMNIPGAIIDLPTLTEKDEEDLVDFGLKQGVDMIAASFVRKAEDIEYIKDVLGPRGSHIQIIAKIENHEGLYNYEGILKAADGIMVARGDLGMELPPEKVFLAQKWMIDLANLAAKPVITATQMLESMIKNPRPTRAEASDVANAVLDGSDCVMLSGETAGGDFPLQAVEIMAKICVEAERCINYKRLYTDIRKSTPTPLSTKEAIASAAAKTAIDLNVDLIIVISETGSIARLVAKYRPIQPVLVCSINNYVIKQLNCTRGTIGFKIPSFQGTDNLLLTIIKAAKERKLCTLGNKVVCIHGMNEEQPEESNILKILDIE